VDAAAIAQQLASLQSQLDELRAERDEYKKLYLLTLEKAERLERGLFGQKAEKLPKNDAQLTLAILEHILGRKPAPEDSAKAGETEVKTHTRAKPTGRKPLPAHLPRVELELIPEEVRRKGLDHFERIGEDSSEIIERRPASVVVVRTVRPKFKEIGADVSGAAKRDGDTGEEQGTGVHMAEPLELPIERGLAGPGMLADTIVRRWGDHCPLHRLESIYARDGIELARSTICGWHTTLAELAQPLVQAMHRDAFEQPYLLTDATGVLLQAKDKCKCGHFWVLVAPGRHGLYRFSMHHNSAAVDELLKGYAGYIVADAHVVYDHLFVENGGQAMEAGCWSHNRRYYFKALATEPELAKAALAMISAIFRIERSIAAAPRKKREQVRKKKSRPIVEQFFAWCAEHKPLVLDDSPIAKAIGYSTNQKEALMRFLDDGRLPIHNNISELQLRREVVGRKNWLFLGSEDGALANTTFVSLLASCQLHRIDPWSYLRDLFCLLPSWPKSRILELAPVNWQQTLEQPDAQQRLAANPFRAVLLGATDHAPILPL
jgi:transposase